MKKIIIKFLSVAIVCIVLLFIINSNVQAKSGAGLVADFGGTENETVKTLAKTTISPVLNVIRIVAVGVSMIMITYLGIKYVSSAPSEKAAIKNQLIILVTGVILISVATTIVDIIQKVSSQAITYTTS